MLDKTTSAPHDKTSTPENGVALAGIVFSKGNNPDAVFRAVADAFAERGIPLAGLVQETQADVPPDCCPPMLVRDVAGKRQMIISEDRGKESQGCRLDWGALASATEQAETALRNGARLLLVNRFGKAESAGQGLRSAIELAIAEGIPVLAGIREDYAKDWETFHGGLATALPADTDAVLAWISENTPA